MGLFPIINSVARTLLLGVIATAAACGSPGPADPRPLPPALVERAELYRAAYPGDSDGFVGTDHCDSLLFSGLAGAAGVPVNLIAARDPETGQWYRRPLSYPECYAAGASRSTISRDQLLGVLWWAWRTGNLAVVEQLDAYARDHNYVMGQDDVAGLHTVLNANLIRLLAEVRHALGGADSGARYLPFSVPEGRTGYEAHLQVLQLLLLGETQGHLPAGGLDALRAHAERQPENPLFLAALARWTGDYTTWRDAVTLLLGHPAWPADRLPGSADRCEYWPVQRDAGADWAPCPEEGATHSGAELLFVVSLL